MLPVDCSIQDTRATEFGTDFDFTVELTDHEITKDMSKWIISKRVAIPKHPGYYLDVVSNPSIAHIADGPQGIVLYVKSQKFLNLSEWYASTMSNGRVDLSITFPKEEYQSVSISCLARGYWP